MPRAGLPAQAVKSRSIGGGAASPSEMLGVAVVAIAFRIVSAVTSSFSAKVFPRSLAEAPSNTFGLYPLFTHAVDRWFGRWLAAPVTPPLVVSWLAFAGAMIMLLLVAQIDVDSDRAERAVLLAMVFPFAFVFGRGQAEGLFLLFTLAAFHAFRRQAWVIGGLCGALATATAPTGVMIVPALAWIGLREPGARRLWVVVGLVLALSGFCFYLAYLYYRGGPPGGWTDATDRWGFHLGHAPWLPLTRLFTSHLAPLEAVSAVVTLIALATIPLVWWIFDGGYAIYMLAMLWFPMTSGRYDELARTCAVLFPMFILLAAIRWRIVVVLIAIASAMFYALNVALSLA